MQKLASLIHIKYRSSPSEVFCKKGVPRTFAKFTEKHLCQSLLFANIFEGNLWVGSQNAVNVRTNVCYVEAVVRRCSVKKVSWNIWRYSQENTCIGTSLDLFNFIKKRLQHKCLPVNTGKFLRTACFIEHLQWLLKTSKASLQRYSFNKVFWKYAAN